MGEPKPKIGKKLRPISILDLGDKSRRLLEK